MNHVYDVIIVGGGAAGIACGRKLREKSTDILLLEARERIGGRIFGVTERDYSIPIEFGPEFIHGASHPTFELLKRFNIPFYDVLDEHFYFQRQKLVFIPNYWDRLGKVMGLLDKNKKDSSVDDFISTLRTRDSVVKNLFKSYVEGFHAADATLMSRRGLAAAEETDDEDVNDSQVFRPLSSYSVLLENLLRSLDVETRLKLQTRVTEIEWRRNHVTLTCLAGPNEHKVKYHSKKVVLTLPLGVLKSDGIKWNPKPGPLGKILSHLQMGHVQKIIFRFRTRFWEEKTKKPLAFFHSDTDQYFPTWWTFQPLRVPFLVAWQGGVKAKEISTWNEAERVGTALKTLSLLTRTSLEKLNSEVQSWRTHNWTEDRYSLGAYSYISVNGLSYAEKLCRPFENTLYFAGEATAPGSGRGTVHGALQSGERAAFQIINHG